MTVAVMFMLAPR